MDVALDSNVLTYFIESTQPDYDCPSDNSSLSVERIAILRIFLYADTTINILPQVAHEYQKIPNFEWRNIHESTTNTLFYFREIGENAFDRDLLQKRKSELFPFHPKESDCQILAEAEYRKISCLLTRDELFVNRLCPRTEVHILYPSQFWERLKISPGSKPTIIPIESNPLYGKTWWKF